LQVKYYFIFKENFVGSDDESSSINDNINIQNQKFKVDKFKFISNEEYIEKKVKS